VFSQGVNGFGATGDSTNAGRPDFSKFEGTASRLQPLPAAFSLLLAAHVSAAKAVDGPRDDWRFFLTLSAKH
jgi:hypothetical protein